MCGLFGFSKYGENTIRDLADLTNALARQSAVRGTDATGIAVCDKGKINITKESKAAYDIKFKHKDNVRALMDIPDTPPKVLKRRITTIIHFSAEQEIPTLPLHTTVYFPTTENCVETCTFPKQK